MFVIKNELIYVSRKTAIALLKAYTVFTPKHIEENIDSGTWEFQVDPTEPKAMLTFMGNDEYAII